MARLRSLLERQRVDATAAWTATALLAGLAVALGLRGEPDWAVLAALLVAVALVVPLRSGDPLVTVPAELLALVTVPVAVRAVGWLPTVTPFLAAAGLALLVAVVLDAFTSLSMTPRFAVVFVVVTTLAFAGAWTVGVYAADVLAGTAFLTDKTELMWDLVAAAGAGVVAGLVFEVYFERSERIGRLRTGGTVDDGTTPDADLPGDPGHHRTAVRLLQAVLAGVAVVALARREATLVVNSAVPLAITFLPALLRREYGYTMDAGLVLWLTLAATLHAVGALGLYGSLGWYDSLTHSLSASVVAGGGYAVARAVERHSEAVTFTRGFRATFVVLFILAVGVAWEILEFATGGLATLVGGEAILAQYGVTDIVNDLVFNAVGALAVATWASAHFEGVAARLTDRVGALAGGE